MGLVLHSCFASVFDIGAIDKKQSTELSAETHHQKWPHIVGGFIDRQGLFRRVHLSVT
jgi:hypothetical protein